MITNSILKQLFFGLLICLSAGYASAQGTIRGFVKDKETGEPMIFILVGLEGTAIGSTTDENGFYSLTKIPAGTYNLLINLLTGSSPGEGIRKAR